jgi:hypothetical protein
MKSGCDNAANLRLSSGGSFSVKFIWAPTSTSNSMKRGKNALVCQCLDLSGEHRASDAFSSRFNWRAGCRGQPIPRQSALQHQPSIGHYH